MSTVHCRLWGTELSSQYLCPVCPLHSWGEGQPHEYLQCAAPAQQSLLPSHGQGDIRNHTGKLPSPPYVNIRSGQIRDGICPSLVSPSVLVFGPPSLLLSSVSQWIWIVFHSRRKTRSEVKSTPDYRRCWSWMCRATITFNFSELI